MNFPLLYQINTCTWLHELSERAGGLVTLGSIPEEEFQGWENRGFTHLWLMGVWKTGPLARAHSLQHFRKHWHSDPDLAGFSETDVIGSPFAIGGYEVANEFGGPDGLASFRRRLHGRGLKLLLDFVPNHAGLDHPSIRDRPELFVQSTEPMIGGFQPAGQPDIWRAHGRDPYFPAWTDTAQLDYRLAATRREMTGVLQSIARQCDGVRCDMAMLLLNEVFSKTWGDFPPLDAAPRAECGEEFWARAIQTIKAGHPDFLFLAEAYWDLEPRLQELGFDYTYDKRVYDHLLNDEHGALQRRLIDTADSILNRSAHFIENHDEARVAKMFTSQKHAPAALLTLALPGLRLIHQGQIEGRRIHQRIQLRRRSPEISETGAALLYERLLPTLRQSRVGKGSPRILRVETPDSAIGVLWKSGEGADVAVVNLSGQAVRARIDWPFSARMHATVLFTGDLEQRPEISWADSRLLIDLAPHASHLLRFTPLHTPQTA